MRVNKQEKKQIIRDFKNHVSSGKVATFRKYGMQFIIGERSGPYITDITGDKTLINCHSNGGVFNLGHRNPQIIEALVKGTQEFDIGNHHLISVQRARLAKKIASLMPEDLDYVVFGVSGGEAVDLAIKLARGYTGRQKIISIKGGYHGHTGLALATGDEQYRKPFGPNLPGFIQIPFNDIEAARKAIDEDTAAFIIETVPATLGISIPSREYMQALRKFTQEKGALLIIDEVQTGFGRTGRLWGFEHFDIVPDIVVLGKGLSGGIYPMTATVFRRPLEKFFQQDPFIHVSTFGGSELGVEVALKVLEISSDPAFLEHVRQMAQLFAQLIPPVIERHKNYLSEFRQIGLMMGLVFQNEKYGVIFSKAAYDAGMLSIYANNDRRVSQLLPPLIIEEKHVHEIVQKIETAVSRLKYYSAIYTVADFIGRLLP